MMCEGEQEMCERAALIYHMYIFISQYKIQTLAHLFPPSLHLLPFLTQLAAQQNSSLTASSLKEEDPLLS